MCLLCHTFTRDKLSLCFTQTYKANPKDYLWIQLKYREMSLFNLHPKYSIFNPPQSNEKPETKTANAKNSSYKGSFKLCDTIRWTKL